MCRAQGPLDTRSWEVRRGSGLAVNMENGSQTKPYKVTAVFGASEDWASLPQGRP